MTKIGSGSFDPSMLERYRSTNGPQGFSSSETNVRIAGEEFRESGLRAIDTTGLQSMRMSDMDADIYDRLVQSQRALLEAKYTSWEKPEMPSLGNHPAYQEFARITVGGQIVARIDNSGQVAVYDSSPSRPNSSRIHGNLYRPGELEADRVGPEWAEELASRVASLVGGQIEKAPSALSPSEFVLPPNIGFSLKSSIDHEAMAADPLSKLLDTMAADRAKSQLGRTSAT